MEIGILEAGRELTLFRSGEFFTILSEERKKNFGLLNGHFWPKVAFFILKCIFGLNLNDIRAYWYHTSSYKYLKQVFKKLVFNVFFSKKGRESAGRGRFFDLKPATSGPKSYIFQK